MSLTISAIPAFSDNYIWAIEGPGRQVVLVDPGDANAAEAFLARRDTLAAILITHHHPDHAGGVAALVQASGCPVYGPANSPFGGITRPLADGDNITLFGESVQVLAVPGHTLDHIAYYWPLPGSTPALFSGDALFAAGCGRLFEGTAAQLFASLQRLAALPAATRLYCAHEYTLSNLRFAAAVEPDNPDISQRLAETVALRDKHMVTLPSDLATERATNPFLRCAVPAVQARASQQAGEPLSSATDTFAALRRWKDHFAS